MMMKIQTEGASYYQSIEDAGRKLKLSARVDISLLRARNYQQSSGDSIDISDIVEEKQQSYFNPFTLLHFPMPENLAMLHSQNYEIEEDSFNFDFQENEEERDKKEDEQQQSDPTCKMQGQQKEQEVKEEKQKDELIKSNYIVPIQYQKEMLTNKEEEQASIMTKLQLEAEEQEKEKEKEKETQKEKGQSKQIPSQDHQEEQQFQRFARLSEPNEQINPISDRSSEWDRPPELFEMQQKKSRKLRRIRSNRKETFSKDLLESIMATFRIMKPENSRELINELSERLSLGVHLLLRMHHEWQSDPTMAKYTNNVQQPLGALVKGKRMRTHLRIKNINEMLKQNPFLTQRQISDKLFEIDKSKKRVLRSAIIRLLKIAGYKRRKIQENCTPQALALIRKERKEFMMRYRQLQANKGQFYYLGECLFHRCIGNDTFWSKDRQIQPQLSKKFIGESMLLVAFLGPTGNLYWQVRGGNYQQEEYTQLLAKMLKKMSGRKSSHHGSNNVVIVSESKLREFQLNKALVEKSGGAVLKSPHRSVPMNPLQTLFEELKQKIKKNMLKSQEQVIKIFSEIARGLKKTDLMGLIQNSKKYLEMAEKEEAF